MRNSDGRAAEARVRVLIVAADAMIAALIALLLDPATYEPVFPTDGEGADEALTRMRPRLVIVLDSDVEAARSDLLYARAQRARATVVLFSAPAAEHDAATLARTRGVPSFRMPTDRETLSRVLDDAVSQAMASGFWGVATILVCALGAAGAGRLPLA